MPSSLRAAVALLLCSCGGSVVFEEPGAGGGPATTATTGPTSSSATTSGPTSSSTGGGPCSSHDDCGPGAVCIFSTGECAPACDGGACQSCGPGSFCQGCATSSCPKCADCRGACLPITAGRCDDDDPCTDGKVCVFSEGFCRQPCGPMGQCNEFEFCDFCATGSCCGCDDCVSACIGGR